MTWLVDVSELDGLIGEVSCGQGVEVGRRRSWSWWWTDQVAVHYSCGDVGLRLKNSCGVVVWFWFGSGGCYFLEFGVMADI
jgi:hypothetical protein